MAESTLSNDYTYYDTAYRQRQLNSNNNTVELMDNEAYVLHSLGGNQVSSSSHNYSHLQRDTVNHQCNNVNNLNKQKSFDCDRVNEATKKIKILLIATVVVNVAMLLLVMTVAIIGSILSQPGSSTPMMIESEIQAMENRYDQLRADTRDNLTQIAMDLDILRQAISELPKLSEGNLTQTITELNITFTGLASMALNQLENTTARISNITAQLNEKSSNISSVQDRVSDLQLQLYCGPGQWRQVVYLNMSDPLQQCPQTWTEKNMTGIRACGRPGDGGCVSHEYPISTNYTRVCGRVIGYQFGSPDAFATAGIDQVYADGVSITHGRAGSRQHIWTYAAGVTESDIVGPIVDNCPCSRFPGQAAPSFVGQNYYCESANPNAQFIPNHLFVNDKLWDGQQCEDSCCTGANTPPWFSTSLRAVTTEAIEVRICGTDHISDEDTWVQFLQLYVQ